MLTEVEGGASVGETSEGGSSKLMIFSSERLDISLGRLSTIAEAVVLNWRVSQTASKSLLNLS